MAVWRYYAQRILGGAWLDRDLELHDVSLTWTLSGPSAMTAKVDATDAGTVAEDGLLVLQEWSTAVYAEADGEIRWGGILTNSTQEPDSTRTLTFTGFAGYPKGRIYMGNRYYQWEADPFDVIRLLWDYVQTDTFGNIGVTVDNDTCPERLGDPSPGVKPVRENFPMTEAGKSDYEAALAEWNNYAGRPYELAWWLTLDCGDEINNAVAEVGAEYLEHHWWIDAEKTQVAHHISLGWPAVGTRRFDLRFVEGENISVPPIPERNGEAFANSILALGAGEERHMLRSAAGELQPGVLRRDMVVAQSDVMNLSRLNKIARDTLKVAGDILFFDSFEVVDHPNARIGAWNVGDEILVQTHSGFVPLERWVLVTEITLEPETGDSATVSVTKL